ncbi:ATP-binding protein [Pelagibacteraceae bacterium]|nr:ATP-binding protein [Pelagibacteraceae bacterium]
MVSKIFNAEESDLTQIRKFIQTFLIKNEIKEDVQYQIILAVGEAAMNIVQHAYKGGDASKKIRVDLNLVNHILNLDFFDQGVKADPSKIKPRKLEEIRPGGLGTHFIKMVMDDVKWGESTDKWVNHLILKKKI